MASAAVPPPEPAGSGEPPLPAYPHRPARRRTCLGGKLVFGEGTFLPSQAFTVDCSIHDLSEGGARIVLDRFEFVQPDLYLIVVKFCVAYRAKVVWQRFPARGLKFSKTYFLNAALPEESNVLRRLWIEFKSAPHGRFG